MISCRSVILNGQSGPTHIGDPPRTGTHPTGRFATPTIRARAAKETVWKILVQSIEGAPSAALLTMRFEAAIATSGGNLVPPAGVGAYGPTGDPRYYWTDLRPQWVILNADEHAALLPDGDFPTQVATSTLAAPVLLIRRVAGGFDHRLSINPTVSGGTNPHFPLSIEVEVRY